MPSLGSPTAPHRPSPLVHIFKGLLVVLILFIFLLGVKGLGDGFKMLGSELLDSFFATTSNPFVALMVGILATSLVQSSSVSTSMIVALCASPENPLPIENAIPMIMGANIGTTVTNTVVSLAHIGRPNEFERAFSVATCHDFFNYMAVILLLPLELLTGFFSKSAIWLASHVGEIGGVTYDSPLKAALKTSCKPLKQLAKTASDSEQIQGLILAAMSGVIIYLALYFLVKTMRSLMQARVERALNAILGKSAFVSITVGVVVTIMVQSSSITTSLLVPLAGAGALSLRSAFPVTLGANIGTTVTALLASMAVSGENATAGLVIALIHFLFNVCATVLIYSLPPIRELPLRAATRLAQTARRSRLVAILYVIALFYSLPALIAYLT